MKRTLTLLVLICMCIALCACIGGNSNETAEPIETIDERVLLNDSNNGARAQMNIGKGTTIHGVISNVGDSACTIRLIHPKDTAVYVEMSVEELAKLDKNLFISIEGVVSSFDALGDKRYTITAKRILDVEEMDAWVKERITNFYNYNMATGGSIADPTWEVYNGIIENFDLELLSAYASVSGDIFRITDDAQLEKYLIGTWVYGPNLAGEKCTYKEDGSYSMHIYDSARYGSSYGSWRHDDWSVSSGRLRSIFNWSYDVYIFNDNLFIYNGVLHLRQQS